MKIKHSKYKNTGILFELLVRQIASDTVSGKDSAAINIVKKYFGKTELTNAWYSLCSLANSDLEKYFLIKLIAAESLPDTVSDATCLTSSSNSIPVFLNLLCFIFI